MQPPGWLRHLGPFRTRVGLLVRIGLFLLLVLAGCQPSGDGGDLLPPTAPSPQVEQQAVESLIQLYRQALLAEDIDRLTALFPAADGLMSAQDTASPATGRQDAEAPLDDVATFRAAMTAAFQAHTLTALSVPPATVQIDLARSRVTFQEVESAADPATLAQHTRVYRTAWQLVRGTKASGTVTFRIGAVRRAGPLVHITTPGQVQAGTLTRVTVTGSEGLFPLASVELLAPASDAAHPFRVIATAFHGTFRAATRAQPQALQLRLRSTSGDELEVTHIYRVRGPGEGVVQGVVGTEAERLLAVTVAPDGTVWAGGDTGARLYQVAPGATAAQLLGPLLPDDPDGRLEDLALDQFGRLHAVVFAPETSGVIVHAQGVFCQTVNVIDAAYPLRDGQGQPSPGSRAVAAGGGDVWLHGSDGGIAQVTDSFRDGQCPEAGVAVRYDPVLRREDGSLLANTVPALLAPADGTLWVGSALGLSRVQDGQVTPVPFTPGLSFQGDPATLEAFFQEVAQAIFAARPLATVALGGVSFVEAFGSSLVKADLIFSLVEDAQGQLWVGTLGGGLRRIDTLTAQDTLHLTRQDGLASNMILALAAGPDGAIWAATDEGVSRIVEVNGRLTITTFGVVDGLVLPARDVAVDAQGTAWVATDGGLFRIAPQGGAITGVVQDVTGTPVEGADVLLSGTPLRAVTDAAGRFTVSNLPSGTQVLQIEGTLAATGPWTPAFREIMVTPEGQTLAPLVVGAPVPIDVVQGGRVTFPTEPGTALDIPPGAVQVPADAPATIGLTTLPLAALPQSLPTGFTAVAAADLQPDGTTFTTPAHLTLPNHAQLPAGQLLILLRFNPATQTYEQLGLGRIRADGTGITTLSGGLTRLSTVVFAATAANATKVFLLPVAGNNQRAAPGEELPEPLVVRLEDQFGHPVVGETVTATILDGDGSFVAVDPVTNADGEARFRVQVGPSDADLIVQVTVPAIHDVRPVQFLAIVGELDTPGTPRDVAVADDVVYVADFSGGLQVIDASDPTRPVLLHTLPTRNQSSVGDVRSVARSGARLYVGSSFPTRLYIVDITNPRAPDFAADRDGDGLADVILGVLDFPGDVLGHVVRDLAVQDTRVYALSNTFTTEPATLLVVDVQDPTAPRLLSATTLPTANPTGLAVHGAFVYVAAEGAGLLTFDVRNPVAPVLVHTLGDPDPLDSVDVALASDVVVAGDTAYVVETRRDQTTQEPTDVLTVLDLRTPAVPQRRGSVPLTTRPQVPLFATGLAIADGFAYVVRGTFGLEALDVRDPAAPRRVGLVDTPSEAFQVATAAPFLYVTDALFGLQVIQGPGTTLADTDGDGTIDFFDAFPTDPAESQDSDGDRLGDQADPDDDNDGFTDAEETAATPPTTTTDPLAFPLRLPPPGVTSLVVDATTALTARQRDGTPAAPYRSVTEALRALRSGLVPQVDTLRVQAGTYAPLTTQEVIPLDLGRLSGLTVQADPSGEVVLDGGLRGDVISAEFSTDLVIEGFVVTRGAIGMSVRESAHVTIRNNQFRDHNEDGIRIGLNANTGIVVTDNLVEANGGYGIIVVGNAAATVTQNTVRFNRRDGIFVALDSTAEIRSNLVEHNDLVGIAGFGGSTAEITDNTITDNRWGVQCFTDTTATITDNTFTGNLIDIGVIDRSTATIAGNAMTDALTGIFLDLQASADIVDNTMAATFTGVHLIRDSAVTLRRNVLTVGGVGLLVEGQGASAVVRSGDFTGSAYAAIQVLGGGELSLGLDDQDEIQIGQNSGVGLLVADDASLVELNSDHIQFAANAGGNVRGSVVDVADTDGDGVGRAAEVAAGTNPAIADTDGDGLRDGFEVRYGFDPLSPGDGEADPDGDGLSNAAEQEAGTDPRNADTDGDGLDDGAEINVYGTDALRPDTDGDGLDDGAEVQVYGTDATRADSDGDGLGDGEEVLLSGLDPLDPGDAAAVVDLVINGGFEAEGGSLSGWTPFNQVSGPSGAWFALAETTSPIRQLQIPLPPQGGTAAIADSIGANLLILSQAVTIPPATAAVLGVDVMVISTSPFITPEAFDIELGLPLSHQFRIDLLDPEAPALAVGDEVLAPLFRTEVDDPPVSGYRRLLFDLTPYAGRRVVLRFAYNQTGLGMVSGIDNVRVLATGMTP